MKEVSTISHSPRGINSPVRGGGQQNAQARDELSLLSRLLSPLPLSTTVPAMATLIYV